MGGCVAVVTGSSRGIGAATALVLAAEGAKVVVNCRERTSEAAAVVEHAGADAFLVVADVSTEEGASLLVDETIARFGRLDVLVNNAGSISREPLSTSTAESWRSDLDANLTSAWLVTRAARPHLREGAIVNVSSVYGLSGAPCAASYAAAKGGLVALTRSFAKELAPGVRVNAVAPGNVLTDLTASGGAQLLAHFEQETPLGRSADPVEIARAILFLASAESSFVTGEVLVVDGGYSIR